MELPVKIEPISHNGYRAHVLGEQQDWCAEGSTPEEALQKLRELMTHKIASGARIVALSITNEEHPWMRFAGDLKDDPMLEEWKQAMAEYRQQVENDPEIP